MHRALQRRDGEHFDEGSRWRLNVPQPGPGTGNQRFGRGQPIPSTAATSHPDSRYKATLCHRKAGMCHTIAQSGLTIMCTTGKGGLGYRTYSVPHDLNLTFS